MAKQAVELRILVITDHPSEDAPSLVSRDIQRALRLQFGDHNVHVTKASRLEPTPDPWS